MSDYFYSLQICLGMYEYQKRHAGFGRMLYLHELKALYNLVANEENQ